MVVSSQKKYNFGLLQKRFIATEPTMFCYQCEQTSHASGCTQVGVCGKSATTSNVQDLLLATNIGLCQHIMSIGEENINSKFRDELRDYLLESAFSTLTNVNFSDTRIIDYIKEGYAKRCALEKDYNVTSDKSLELSYNVDNKSNDEIINDSIEFGILERNKIFNDKDCLGLRETLQVGLKGAYAYFCHSEMMYKENNNIYGNEERENIWKTLISINSELNSLNNNKYNLNDWLGLNMKLGEINVSILDVLDKSHNNLFGTPEVTVVPNKPIPGKGILLSGHDVLDVKIILEAISESNLDINVYTHGELLPAHSYPELKKYSNLIGHFGSAWQNQVHEFKKFKGPIIMTSNCLMPPRRRYRKNLYTTNAVGYDDIQHVNLKNKDDIKKLLNQALEMDGLNENDCKEWSSKNDFTIGFGHNTLSQHIDTVVNAIKEKELTDLFFIGGCDGTEKSRSYFNDISLLTHNKSLILTAGCGKYRLTDNNYGTLGNSGIPRLLDMGQCNDSYSGVVIALKVAEKLGIGLHDLPLHFCVSWFEQKAVVIFLSLLHLGVQNIRLGPELPAFLTPNLIQFLHENFKVRQIDDPEDDYSHMLSETC